MAVDKKDSLLEIIFKPNYKFNYDYGICFLTPESYNILSEALSELRRLGEGNEDYFFVAKSIFKLHNDNYYKIKRLNSMQPRLIAQKFIGKKNVRQFIFNRDSNQCLNCGKKEKLQLDHIVPISKGGENKLSNLQTLCNSCNSIKKDNYKDYRYGSR